MLPEPLFIQREDILPPHEFLKLRVWVINRCYHFEILSLNNHYPHILCVKSNLTDLNLKLVTELQDLQTKLRKPNSFPGLLGAVDEQV